MLGTPVHRPNIPVRRNDIPATEILDRPQRASNYHRSDRVVLVPRRSAAALIRPHERTDAVSSRLPGHVLPFTHR